jgi:hypothetical protein
VGAWGRTARTEAACTEHAVGASNCCQKETLPNDEKNCRFDEGRDETANCRALIEPTLNPTLSSLLSSRLPSLGGAGLLIPSFFILLIQRRAFSPSCAAAPCAPDQTAAPAAPRLWPTHRRS